ncbi:unnamed protein product [Allacma fusca]|uniref:Uncharacterized protein n=1 Tax=Allacma fusca TaxID=39272 RepID=A0A8J2LFM6_9HEXA|nr:unnamed protein product [Allacma fusca]
MQFENEDQSNRNSLGFGQSLFRTLSNSRECKDAGIPEEFCSCRNYELTSTNSSRITEVARYVVAQVNEEMRFLRQKWALRFMVNSNCLEKSRESINTIIKVIAFTCTN